MDFATLLQTVTKGTLPWNGGFTACRTSNNLDADDYVRDWASVTLINWAPFPPELADLYKATRRELDAKKRLVLLADLQKKVRDWTPVIPLYQEIKIYALSPRVVGFQALSELHMDFRPSACGSSGGDAAVPPAAPRPRRHRGVGRRDRRVLPRPPDRRSRRVPRRPGRHARGGGRGAAAARARPAWIVQYLDFLAAVPRGDFGTSIRERRPAMVMVFQHFWPATVELAAAAIALSTVLRHPARHRLGHAQGPRRRPREPHRVALSPIHAGLLARADADPDLRGGAQGIAARPTGRGASAI